MASKTTPPRRRRQLALVGTAVAGCTLFSGLGIAQAQYLDQPGQTPYILLIDGMLATGTDYVDDVEVDGFSVSDRDISASVVHDDGLLEITDEDGDVVCSMDHGVSPCPFELEPGRHVLRAAVTDDDGETRVSEPVVVLSNAPDKDPQEVFDGVAPAPVQLVEAVASTQWYFMADATFSGQPGDVVRVYVKNGRRIADAVVDAGGRFTAEVPTHSTGATVVVETRRDGERLRTEVDVPGVAQDEVVATPVQLDSATRVTGEDNGYTYQLGRFVVSGTPFASVEVRTDLQHVFTGTLDHTGHATWDVSIGNDAVTYELRATSRGESAAGQNFAESSFTASFDAYDPSTEPVVPADPSDEATDPGFTAPVVAEPAPGDVDPGFTAPVVAEPAPDATDPGFTIPGSDDSEEPEVPGEPVVAEPAPGDVDPGFTAPVVADPSDDATDPGFTIPGSDDGEDDSAPAVPLLDVTAGERPGTTRLTFESDPWSFLLVGDDTGWRGYAQTDHTGRATIEIPDFLVGQTRQVTVEVPGTAATSTYTVEGKGRAAVETTPLTLDEVLPSDTATVQVVLNGQPGNRYVLYTRHGQTFEGIVPADGKIRHDLTFDGAVTWIDAVTFGDTGARASTFEITAPGTPDEGQVLVTGSHAGPGFATTVATLQSRPYQGAEIRDATTGNFHGYVTFDQDGRAETTLSDLSEGQTRDLLVSVYTSTGPRTTRVTVEGKGVAPVAAQALTLEDVLPSTTHRAQVVLRGLPGQEYSLYASDAQASTWGVVPEDGLVRWDLDFPADTVEIDTTTRGDAGSSADARITVTALPGTEPPATPGGADTDPGFGTPSAPGFGTLDVKLGFLFNNGDGRKLARLKVVDPAAEKPYWAHIWADGHLVGYEKISSDLGYVSARFADTPGDHTIEFQVDGAYVKTFTITLPGDTDQPGTPGDGDTDQPGTPGDGDQGGQPEVPGDSDTDQPEVPADGDDQGGQPEVPGDFVEGASMVVDTTIQHAAYGGSQLFMISDPGTTAKGYWATVKVDGETRDVVRLTPEPSYYAVHQLGFGSGEHTIEFVVGDVVKTVTITI